MKLRQLKLNIFKMTKPKPHELILDIAREKQKDDWDSVFLVTGREGVGKSTFVLTCLDYLGVKSCKGVVAMDGETFLNNLASADYNGVVVSDEAGESLFSRDAMSKVTKTLVKIFIQIRAKRLITFLVLPNIAYIDKYFRTHRVSAMFHVYRRGQYIAFSRKTMEKTVFKNGYIPVKQRLKQGGYYPKYSGQLKKEYDILKDKVIKGLGKDKTFEFSTRQKVELLASMGFDDNTIAEKVDISKRQYRRYKKVIAEGH
jgi:hypothetical protein